MLLDATTGWRPRSSEQLHVALTLGTGVIDAVSYVSLDHVFTANMSGNMALLGICVASGFGSVVGNLLAFVGFVLGSIGVGRWLRRRPSALVRAAVDALAAQLALMIVLTVIVGVVDLANHDVWRNAACGLLAAAMGVQTGVARGLSVKDVNTTVATMTLHDLAAASRLAGGDSVRWRRRASAVLTLFLGAALGIELDQHIRWGGLFFVCSIVAGVMVVLVASSECKR